MSNNLKIEVKAGLYLFDKQTKKVKASKDKGLITVYRKDEQTHFSWANLDTKQQQIDLIVFANDAVFDQVVGKNNTYILRFQTDDDRYFFWFQENIPVQKTIQEINKIINTTEQMDIQPQKEAKPSPLQIQQTVKASNKPNIDQFITKMQNNIIMANKNKGKVINHLSDVINSQAINFILKEISEENRKNLIDFLPQTQQSDQFISQNVRSPQFLQALEALTDALNSQNVIALFMELGLDRSFLKKYYGVEAFLRALDDWARRQQKKQQKKQ